MRLSESRSEGLMLALNRDTVEFEANMVLLIRFQVAKWFMESETNFTLMDKVRMTFIPVPLFSVPLTDEDAIAWKDSDCWKGL